MGIREEVADLIVALINDVLLDQWCFLTHTPCLFLTADSFSPRLMRPSSTVITGCCLSSSVLMAVFAARSGASMNLVKRCALQSSGHVMR